MLPADFSADRVRWWDWAPAAAPRGLGCILVAHQSGGEVAWAIAPPAVSLAATEPDALRTQWRVARYEAANSEELFIAVRGDPVAGSYRQLTEDDVRSAVPVELHGWIMDACDRQRALADGFGRQDPRVAPNEEHARASATRFEEIAGAEESRRRADKDFEEAIVDVPDTVGELFERAGRRLSDRSVTAAAVKNQRVLHCTDSDTAVLLEALQRRTSQRREPRDYACDDLEVRISKPWGGELKFYEDAVSEAWLMNIDQGSRTPMHAHTRKTTLLICISGEGQLTTGDDEDLPLVYGSIVRVMPGARHCVHSSTGMRLVEFQTPRGKPDVLRFEDARRERPSFNDTGGARSTTAVAPLVDVAGGPSRARGRDGDADGAERFGVETGAQVKARPLGLCAAISLDTRTILRGEFMVLVGGAVAEASDEVHYLTIRTAQIESGPPGRVWSTGGRPVKFRDALQAEPEIGGSFCGLVGALLDAMPSRTHELVALRLSAVLENSYVWTGHCHMALRKVLTHREIAGIAAGTAALTGRDAVVLQAVDELVETGLLSSPTRAALGDEALGVMIATGTYRTVASIMQTVEPEHATVAGLESPARARETYSEQRSSTSSDMAVAAVGDDVSEALAPDGCHVVDVQISPRVAPEQRPFPLPPAFAAGDQDVLVGRVADLEALDSVFAQVADGSRRLVALRGEPGIGKTRLATEFALRAHADGAIVLHGRCDQEALLALQPFVQALRHYVDVCPAHVFAGRLRSVSGELRRMLPELADRIPDLPEPLAGDPKGARSRLFEAVSALLCDAAQSTPVVLVLEDLHWADTTTLLLLKYLLRYPRQARLLILGTYRETELDIDHPLSRTLAELDRERLVDRRAVAPLDAAAVSQLVDVHAGNEASPELHQIVYEGTEGNAFFVVEMLRHLADSGAIGDAGAGRDPGGGTWRLSVPEGVKDIIGQRLARLGPATIRVLTVASVLGQEFKLDVLQHLSGLDEDELVDRLDSAVCARVIQEVTDTGGHFIFSHALICETLYGDLSATRRALLHRRVGAALEQGEAKRQAAGPTYRETLDDARLVQELHGSWCLARGVLTNNRGLFSSAFGVDRDWAVALGAAFLGYDSVDSHPRADLWQAGERADQLKYWMLAGRAASLTEAVYGPEHPGGQSDAPQVYVRPRAHLTGELGLEPGPALQRASDRPGLTSTGDPAAAERAGVLPSGVVTFLLTDVEGSAGLWDVDADAMAAALELLDGLIARLVEAHAGRLLQDKAEGDSTLSVFQRASDAVSCAAELQRDVATVPWPARLELRLRVALHSGEAQECDGDYFGPVLNRTARLRSLAAGGVTVLSQSTAELVRDRLAQELTLVDVGRHELRGLPRSERVFELREAADGSRVAAGPIMLSLPSSLSAAAGWPFVGRVSELAGLRERWAAVGGGAASAVLLGGEAGIGKTRLASELARTVHEQGALVLSGRCDEGLAVPYQPFVEALRPYVRAFGVDRLRAQLGDLAPELGRLLPELGVLGEPVRADPESERDVLFEAVAALLEAMTREQRALLVLDDLHWAASPTLLLLRHLIRSERPLNVLLLSTYRETELDGDHQLAKLLADLHRDSNAARLNIGGLDERAIAALVDVTVQAGAERAELVRILEAQTAGNPFFIRELLAHLAGSGARTSASVTAAGLDAPEVVRHAARV